MSLSINTDIQVSLEFPFCLLNINLFVKSISHFFLTQLTDQCSSRKSNKLKPEPLGLEEEFPKLADVPSRERPHIPYQSALLSRWFSSFQGVPVFFIEGAQFMTFSHLKQVLIFSKKQFPNFSGWVYPSLKQLDNSGKMIKDCPVPDKQAANVLGDLTDFPSKKKCMFEVWWVGLVIHPSIRIHGNGIGSLWVPEYHYWGSLKKSRRQWCELLIFPSLRPQAARNLLADALNAATTSLAPEPRLGFSCSLGREGLENWRRLMMMMMMIMMIMTYDVWCMM